MTRCAASVPARVGKLSMILKYDQTIRENTMSVNGLYNSRSELIREHAAEAASGLQKGPAK